jgi:hypothetical protein
MDESKSPGGVSQRVMDVADENGALRPLLHGMFPADLPVPTLNDALEAVKDNLPNLTSLLKLATKHVKKQKRTGKIPKAMSDDLCVAITLYTMEDQPREKSLYYQLNKSLRAQDRSCVRHWRDFIWLFLHALKHLPTSSVRVVFRGVKQSLKDLDGTYQKGEGAWLSLLLFISFPFREPFVSFSFSRCLEIQWAGFSSTATNADVLQSDSFLGKHGHRTLLAVELDSLCGRDIQAFSLFPSEYEVRVHGWCVFIFHCVLSVHRFVSRFCCRQTSFWRLPRF